MQSGFSSNLINAGITRRPPMVGGGNPVVGGMSAPMRSPEH
jgi:hypothetical protein